MTDGSLQRFDSTGFIFGSLVNTKDKLLVAGEFGVRKLCSLPVVGFKMTGNDGKSGRQSHKACYVAHSIEDLSE